MTDSALVERARLHRPRLARAMQGPVLPWVVLGVAAVGVARVAAVDPNEPGHYPLCPLYAVTGLYCPGCGALRATHALAHGDLASALGFNVLFVLVLPLLAGAWLLWVRRRNLGLTRRLFVPVWMIWTLLGVEIAFTVLRNLPWFAVLAP